MVWGFVKVMSRDLTWACCWVGPVGKKTANPLKQVLDAIGETIECRVYDSVRLFPISLMFRTSFFP